MAVTKSSRQWNYVKSQNGDIYSAEDLEKLKEHIIFPVERASIINGLAQEDHIQPTRYSYIKSWKKSPIIPVKKSGKDS